MPDRKLGWISRAALAALICCLAMPPGALAAKGKGGGTVDVTQAVNQGIPDRGVGTAAPFGLLTSTITVGKQFKGRQIRDVNVTVQTTGVSPTNSAALDIRARLTAPNGASAVLFQIMSPGNAVGPLTLDDETVLSLGFGAPIDPQSLFTPWAGTAQPVDVLFGMDGGPAKGDWKLKMVDRFNGDTSTLVQWGLEVTTGRPFQTK